MSFWRSLRPLAFWDEEEAEEQQQQQPAAAITEQPVKETSTHAPSILKPIGEDPYSAISASGGFSKFKQISNDRPVESSSTWSKITDAFTLKKASEKQEATATSKEHNRELERLKAFKREGEDLLVSRYLTLLSRRTLDLEELRREVAENFIPDSVRDLIWKLLCGYMPADAASRDTFIKQAREAYVYTRDKLYAAIPATDEAPDPHGDRNLIAQIRVDIPRTNPIDGVTYFKHVTWLFSQPHIQTALEHVCFVWAKQHHDTGYFQGFSDLLVPFFVVFSVTFASPDGLMALSSGRARKAEVLSQLDWDSLEADTYWCLCRMLRMLPPGPNQLPAFPPPLSKAAAARPVPLPPPPLESLPPPPSARLLATSVNGFLIDSDETNEAAIDAARSEDWISMHKGLYLRCLWGIPQLAQVRGVLPTASHPGIHSMVRYVRQIIAFYDPTLSKHFDQHRVDFMFFCMRWVICLMTRELPLCALLQLWDQYMVSDNLYLTHAYVCAAMLITFRGQLLEHPFGEMMMFLQSLPSQLWDAEENQLFDPAYHLKKVFKLSGIIYQEHVRSKDAFIASYLICSAALRGYISTCAYIQTTVLLFVIEKLDAASKTPVVIVDDSES